MRTLTVACANRLGAGIHAARGARDYFFLPVSSGGTPGSSVSWPT